MADPPASVAADPKDPTTTITKMVETAPATQLSPLSGAYLLIVVGEPFSEEHKKLILQKIQQGRRNQIYNSENLQIPELQKDGKDLHN